MHRGTKDGVRRPADSVSRSRVAGVISGGNDRPTQARGDEKVAAQRVASV